MSFFISNAYGQSIFGGAGGAAGLASYLPIVVMFAAVYFLMIRPQMKRQKEVRSMLDALAKGDEVLTTGGIVGKVTKLDEGYVGIEIAANTEITVQKSAITTVLPKGTLKSL